MTRALTLSLPTSDFDKLHQQADGRGKKATVSKESLRLLLIDHSRALSRLSDLGEHFKEPEFEEPYKTHPKIRQADEK